MNKLTLSGARGSSTATPTGAAARRVGREMLLDALISFMKGEIHNDEFDAWRSAAVRECRGEGDRSAADVGHLLWFFYDDGQTRGISVSPEQWQALRRYAAFLKTDLGIQVIKEREFRPGQIAALAGLLLIGTAAGFWWLAGASPVLLAASWAIVGGIWALWPRRRLDAGEAQDSFQFAPFWSEQQWREYESLLESYQLPAFCGLTHHQPCGRSERGWLCWLRHRAAGLVFLPVALVLNLLPGALTAYMVAPAGPANGEVPPLRPEN